MPEMVRMLRIMEYRGTREWLEKTLTNGAVPANGTRRIDDKTYITSSMLGTFPEHLTDDGESKA